MKWHIRAVAAAAMAAIGAAAFASPSFAADPEACKKVRFSDVGWTDITATTATATVILEALGYEPDIQVLSVPVTYTSLKNKDIDVFLGNWMPTMEDDIKPYPRRRLGRDARHQPRRREVHARRSEVHPGGGAQGLRRHREVSRTSSAARSTASSPATTATASSST